jgi:hypothetical protein
MTTALTIALIIVTGLAGLILLAIFGVRRLRRFVRAFWPH